MQLRRRCDNGRNEYIPTTLSHMSGGAVGIFFRDNFCICAYVFTRFHKLIQIMYTIKNLPYPLHCAIIQ
jgi:hypothetical protein